MKHSRLLRFVHAILAIGISVQLLLSLLMDDGSPSRDSSGLAWVSMELHETVGMIVLAAIFLHWMLFPLGYAGRDLGHFYPWFSRSRLRELKVDFRSFLRLEWSDPSKQEHMAGAIQGIGLAVATGLAMTGAVIYFGTPEDGAALPAAAWAQEAHEMLGPAMWAYLALHAGAAAVHALSGHRAILSIFDLFSTRKD